MGIQPELWVGQPQDAMALPSKLDVPDDTLPTRAYTIYPSSKIQPLCSVYVVEDPDPCLARELVKVLLTDYSTAGRLPSADGVMKPST